MCGRGWSLSHLWRGSACGAEALGIGAPNPAIARSPAKSEPQIVLKLPPDGRKSPRSGATEPDSDR